LQVLKKICSLHITEIVTLKSKGIYSSILDKAIFSIYHEQFIYETYQKTLLFVEIETFFGLIIFSNFIVYPRNRARFFWCACAFLLVRVRALNVYEHGSTSIQPPSVKLRTDSFD
jgi:hypothetical protein